MYFGELHNFIISLNPVIDLQRKNIVLDNELV